MADAELVEALTQVVEELGPRSRRDVLHWLEAVAAGDDGWLILRSLPGKDQVDAWHHSKLGSGVRRAIGP